MKRITNRRTHYRTPVICILLLCIAGILNIISNNYYAAIVEFIAALVVLIYTLMITRSKAKDMAEYMSIITEQGGNLAEILSCFPLPMLVLSVDGKIMWYNDMAMSIFAVSDLFDQSITELMPQLKWTQVLKSTEETTFDIEHGDRYYKVYSNLIKRKDANSDKESYSVLLYFNDCTESITVSRLREEEKIDVAIVTIDNYDDIFQTMDDTIAQDTIGKINSLISKWVSESNGVMKKINSDRFMVFFEHKHLDMYIKNKFDILDKVRAIGEDIKEPITISIGIGTGSHISENESFAKNSVEMVWGRGGDQVAVKDSESYNFYGGTAKDYEKSTRVKTRIFSNTLKAMIQQSDKVIIMGHKGADYDSFGAAMGISRACKILNTPAYIVLDNSPAVRPIYDELVKMPEYQGLIIQPSSAYEYVTEDTLVIIVDTHRTSMLPAPDLLNMVTKKVLIDHHRRSTEYVENLSLAYLEPSASSTCEVVTEILQYIDDKKQLSSFEAKVLYIGIMMDTKNFITKTGVKTFEAASYLKRYGINIMDIKKLFNLPFDEYIKRMEIIRKAEIWNSDIAVSICFESYNNMRVVSSQAADEMLNISGVKAAFVIYPGESEVYLSARSFGEINVQVIMEKLGGGGHMSVAGCQLKATTVSEARDMLKSAIKEYIEENN